MLMLNLFLPTGFHNSAFVNIESIQCRLQTLCSAEQTGKRPAEFLHQAKFSKFQTHPSMQYFKLGNRTCEDF